MLPAPGSSVSFKNRMYATISLSHALIILVAEFTQLTILPPYGHHRQPAPCYLHARNYWT